MLRHVTELQCSTVQQLDKEDLKNLKSWSSSFVLPPPPTGRTSLYPPLILPTVLISSFVTIQYSTVLTVMFGQTTAPVNMKLQT